MGWGPGMGPPRPKCKLVSSAEGKAMLIKKIFRQAKVIEQQPVRPKKRRRHIVKDEIKPQVEDEIDLCSFGLKEEEETKLDPQKIPKKEKKISLKHVKKPWKLWKCSFCNKRFAMLPSLKMHCKKRHPFKTLDKANVFIKLPANNDEQENNKQFYSDLDCKTEKTEKLLVTSNLETGEIPIEEPSSKSPKSPMYSEPLAEHSCDNLDDEDLNHDDEETDPFEGENDDNINDKTTQPESGETCEKVVTKVGDDEEEENALVSQKARALCLLNWRARQARAKKSTHIRKILAKKKEARQKRPLRMKIFTKPPTTLDTTVETFLKTPNTTIDTFLQNVENLLEAETCGGGYVARSGSASG
jgi:hypothetical protein